MENLSKEKIQEITEICEQESWNYVHRSCINKEFIDQYGFRRYGSPCLYVTDKEIEVGKQKTLSFCDEDYSDKDKVFIDVAVLHMEDDINKANLLQGKNVYVCACTFTYTRCPCRSSAFVKEKDIPYLQEIDVYVVKKFAKEQKEWSMITNPSQLKSLSY